MDLPRRALHRVQAASLGMARLLGAAQRWLQAAQFWQISSTPASKICFKIQIRYGAPSLAALSEQIKNLSLPSLENQ